MQCLYGLLCNTWHPFTRSDSTQPSPGGCVLLPVRSDAYGIHAKRLQKVHIFFLSFSLNSNPSFSFLSPHTGFLFLCMTHISYFRSIYSFSPVSIYAAFTFHLFNDFGYSQSIAGAHRIRTLITSRAYSYLYPQSHSVLSASSDPLSLLSQLFKLLLCHRAGWK